MGFTLHSRYFSVYISLNIYWNRSLNLWPNKKQINFCHYSYWETRSNNPSKKIEKREANKINLSLFPTPTELNKCNTNKNNPQNYDLLQINLIEESRCEKAGEKREFSYQGLIYLKCHPKHLPPKVTPIQWSVILIMVKMEQHMYWQTIANQSIQG